METYFYKKIIAQVITAAILTSFAMAQSNKPVKEFLGLPVTVTFDAKSYGLSWSTHPSVGFYKQEYLPLGANADRYQSMLLTDVVTGNQDIKAVVTAKKQELENLKVSNPFVNYEVIHNPKSGEYLIDFLLSANGADGNQSIVEHNIYRYALFTDKNGIKGIRLFGISTRAYGSEIDAFLVKLKSNRPALIKQVSVFALPNINIK